MQLQAREIEALRAELIMLKRKEAPQLSQTVGTVPPNAPGTNSMIQEGSIVGGGQYEGQLPPIPGSKMSKTNMK